MHASSGSNALLTVPKEKYTLNEVEAFLQSVLQQSEWILSVGGAGGNRTLDHARRLHSINARPGEQPKFSALLLK